MHWLRRLFPWTADVDRRSLRADALAGVLGAVLVMPQGVAFATLAGLPPQMGLATAVLPAVVAAIAGSSRHVVTGPTNALSLALLAMLVPLAVAGSAEYVQLALALTLLVGGLQLAVGALRLGTLAHFISPVALHGFTAGAALLIALHALPDLLGLAVDGRGAGAAGRALVRHAGDVQPAALAVGAVTLAVALGVRRRWRLGPHLLLGLVAGGAAAWGLQRAGMPVALLGDVPGAWPQWQWPRIDVARWAELLPLAGALTLVALAQSFAIAKTLAARSGQHLDTNREFIGQGLANLAGGAFSCYVACGSLNRSLPNFEAGARTPLAAVFAAAVLLALVAALAPWLAAVPLAAIAALLLLVALSLLDVPRWRRIAAASSVEFAIALATTVATLLLRLELAIAFGAALSLGAYLWRTSRPAMRTMGFDRRDAERPFVVVDGHAGALPECPQLKLLRMEGSVFFGAVEHVAQRLAALRAGDDAPKHLLVMAKSMNFIDLAGADLWRDELRARRAMGGDLYFHRPRPDVLETWRRTGFIDELGADHVFADKRSAIAAIVARLDRERCARCNVKLFHESPR